MKERTTLAALAPLTAAPVGLFPVVARHRDVAAARDALSRVGATRTEAQQQALRARVERPDATLAELAGWIGWSKDRYAAVLRRALIAACESS